MKKTYSNPQIEVITMATRQMLAKDTTMKKTYSNPQIEVITMATRQMLASSVEVQVVGGEFEGSFNSRENDFFLDEE